ncbi:MAG: alpha-amylase [Bacteroidales bacterium]|nr:alpha-amylase [Bacteroidales bacterium]
MKSICFFFQLHQPLRLKRYRFFEIGTDHYYYNDFANEDSVRYLADNCYLPANRTLLEMIQNTNGKFKVAFSISGVLLEQLEQYAPEVIDSFKELVDTGSVELLGEPYAHSLSALYDENEFKAQVKRHSQKIESLFGQTPKVFCNTELIYSDEIGEYISKLGFKGALLEGARHILGWKSANYTYKHPYVDLTLLPRNTEMSDNIAFRFSNWGWDQYPLTADKYINWVADMKDGEDFMVVGMNYGALGINNHADSGIFEFFKALPYQAMIKKVNFMTPSEVIAKSKNDDVLTTGEPISWADEEKDLSAWNGNDLQGEALQKLYAVSERVRLCTDRAIKYDWLNLQACDNFYYMSTKHFAGNTTAHTGPYESPYEAFMNYMNILSDFLQRVDEQYPTTIDNEELNSLLKTINNQESQIVELEEEIAKLKAGKKPAKAKEEPAAPKAKAEPKAKKAAAAKKTTKK